jgi:hypothetical protein
MVEVSMMEIGLLGVGLIVGFVLGKMTSGSKMLSKGNFGNVEGGVALKGDIDNSHVGGNQATGKAKQNN